MTPLGVGIARARHLRQEQQSLIADRHSNEKGVASVTPFSFVSTVTEP
jgi:hypothetical protein